MIRVLLRIALVFLFVYMLSSLAYASGTYQEGDEDPEVALIQTKLQSLGYEVGNIDGDFGALTTAAVKAFQKDRGLEIDGVVGAITYRVLMGRDMPVSRDSSVAAARKVIQQAMRYIGVPYVYGGNTPSGFDCSGFTRYVYGRVGISLPRTADAQYEVGVPVSISKLRPGDIVYFTTYAPGASHNGIYIGEGKFIHASSSRGVAIDQLAASYWKNRYLGARRIL